MSDLKTFKVNSPALMASMILISGGCFHKTNKEIIMSIFVTLCLQLQFFPKTHQMLKGIFTIIIYKSVSSWDINVQ